MTVFKTFLKIVKKNKFVIIMYSCLLVLFGGINMSQNDNSIATFKATKPRVLLVNNDKNGYLSNDLVKYLKKNTKPSNINYKDKEVVDDALFYREIEYIIIIPDNYTNDFLNNKNKEIEIKSTGSYHAEIVEMMLSRYLKAATIYKDSIIDKDTYLKNINESLSNNLSVDVSSKLNTNDMDRAAFYFNFESYSILACVIYVIGIVVITFNQTNVKKRTLISSMNHDKYNFYLFLSNCLYALVMWLFYFIMSVILIGSKVIFTTHGLFFLINSFIFTLSVTSIAFFISNIIKNKEALTGVMNVIAIGSSFLCGAFVPAEWLPTFVRRIGHIFPTQYYIDANDTIKTIDKFNFHNLKSIYIDFVIMIIFMFVFIILTNYVTKKKRKIA